jgi:hypothetical protein
LPTINAAGDYDMGARTLRGIDIWGDGDVKVMDVDGNIVTRTFVGISGSLPFRWAVQIQKLYGIGNGTTVALASLDLLH